MIDERICGARNEEGITCLLLPDHPTPTHAGFRADCTVVLWPRTEGDYQPQHSLHGEQS